MRISHEGRRKLDAQDCAVREKPKDRGYGKGNSVSESEKLGRTSGCLGKDALTALGEMKDVQYVTDNKGIG